MLLVAVHAAKLNKGTDVKLTQPLNMLAALVTKAKLNSGTDTKL
jgi:hypothetical protein